MPLFLRFFLLFLPVVNGFARGAAHAGGTRIADVLHHVQNHFVNLLFREVAGGQASFHLYAKHIRLTQRGTVLYASRGPNWPADAAPAVEPETAPTAESAPAEEPAPRRRGRPRKERAS